MGGGGNVGTGVVVAGVGGGVLTTGADVCGGVVLAGALVTGALVMLMLGSGENEADADAEADGDAEPELAGAIEPRTKKNSRTTMSTVVRLPTTPASQRSTQRGPRRGGGMSLVVSEPMPLHGARAMPRAA